MDKKPGLAIAIINAAQKGKKGGMPADKSGEEMDEKIVCARDLLDAVKADDEQGVVDAIEALFGIFDSSPHDEYGGE